MIKSAITHKSYSNYIFPISQKTLKIRLIAAKNDLKEVKVIYGNRFVIDGSEPYKIKKMELKASSLNNDFFETNIKLSDPRFRYHFVLDDGDQILWYNEKGFSVQRPRGIKSGFFQYSLISDDDLIKRPNWLDGAVVYQIFPERFCNGNNANDPENISEWGELPERDSFFGGDLKGIYQKLDYLEELGINVIYLTPIFQSPTNHKYNIDDYLKIDEHFGDKEIFGRLVDEAHKKGIKIILDAVFNHSGYDFFAFKDLREKGKDSEYKNWYIYDSLPLDTEKPVNYETFARNIPDLPKLDTADREVQDYLLNVAEYWTEEFEIDGWRLDVADEVDPSFWRRFRERIKSIDSETYIVGEIWHSGQKWLQGDQFDAIMNYTFTEAVKDFIAKNEIGPAEFDSLLTQNRMNYRTRISYSMLNLLDSHDTARILHHCDENKAKMKLAVFFQMTYPGLPMVLYGDEVGLTGGKEPDSRRCMVWEDSSIDSELMRFYKQMIEIRKNSELLQKGSYETFLIDEAKNIYGFKRCLADQELIIILNNSPISRELKLNLAHREYKELFSSRIIKSSKLEIDPFQGMILKAKI